MAARKRSGKASLRNVDGSWAERPDARHSGPSPRVIGAPRPRRKRRVAVVTTHPIQYFAPLFAYLTASPDIEITALYLSDSSLRGARDEGFGREVAWDIDLLEGYPHKFVGPRWRELEPRGFRATFVPEIYDEVRCGGYDALWVNGHVVSANFVAMAAARAVGIPALMRCETHLCLPGSVAKKALRRPLLGALYAMCDGLLAIGSRNREFYRAMGAPDDKISSTPYAIDNARFMRDARLSPEERAAVRRCYGLSADRPALLFVSKLQRRKRPDDLLHAAARLAAEGLEFDLVIAGSGEMSEELESTAAALGVANVLFPGFVNQRDMPRLLGACDLFALPASGEPWGLVVNEAMCAGLPIVISREIGCSADLLREGVNGFGFAAGDVGGLVEALRPLIVDAGLRAAMSEASLRIIGEWDFSHCLDGLRDALDKTTRA